MLNRQYNQVYQYQKNDLTKYANLEKQIINLKNDIDEIKNLLLGLKNGSN